MGTHHSHVTDSLNTFVNSVSPQLDVITITCL